MAINNKIYEDKYRYISREGDYELFTTTDKFANAQIHNMATGTAWDSSNVYTTFDPEGNQGFWFGSNPCEISFDGEFTISTPKLNFISIQNIFESPKQVNLRLAFCETTSGNIGEPLMLNWSALDPDNFTKSRSFENPLGIISFYTRRTTLCEKDGAPTEYANYPLQSSNFQLINSIKRSNLFLGVYFSLTQYNPQDGTFGNGGISMTSELMQKFMPGGEFFEKQHIEWNGTTYTLGNFNYKLFSRSAPHDENESFSVYNGYRRQNADGSEEIIAGLNTYSSQNCALQIISEIEIDGNVYYLKNNCMQSLFAGTVLWGSIQNASRDPMYLSSANSYDEAHAEYYMLKGADAENYKKSIHFYPYSGENPFTLDGELNRDQYPLGTSVSLVENIENAKYESGIKAGLSWRNPSGSSMEEGIRFYRPTYSMKMIFEMLSCLLIPFTFLPSNSPGDRYQINKETQPDAYIGIREKNGFVKGNYIPYVWGVTEPEDDFRPDGYKPIGSDTVERLYVGSQIPGEIYLGSNPIKSMKYGEETVWGDA